MPYIPPSRPIPDKPLALGLENSDIPDQRTPSTSPSEWEGCGGCVLRPPSPASKDPGHTGRTDALSGRLIHKRSFSFPLTIPPKVVERSSTSTEGDSDDETGRDHIVRKDSGEIVRPVLRSSSRLRRSTNSLIRSKSVHFDANEDVRFFFRLERPLAVSSGSFPLSESESGDDEYCHFNSQGLRGATSASSELGIITTALPPDSPFRRALPVKLERVWLSSNQRSLFGSVAAANLAFEKCVTCRFTLEHWKTMSDVAARYTCEVLSTEGGQGYDRFIFEVDLSDVMDLESKTLYFCLRYNVDGREFWDNNNGSNFQIKFRKKHLLRETSNKSQEAWSRPLNGRRSPSDTLPQKSYGHSNPGFDKHNRPSGNESRDNLPPRFLGTDGPALSGRYDFGAALIAAMQAAKPTSDDRDMLYMKQPVRPAAARTRASDIASASYAEILDKYCFFNPGQSLAHIKGNATAFNTGSDGLAGTDSAHAFVAWLPVQLEHVLQPWKSRAVGCTYPTLSRVGIAKKRCCE